MATVLNYDRGTMTRLSKLQKCSECGHEWTYNGNDRYVTCPNCTHSFTMSDAQFKDYLHARAGELMAKAQEIEVSEQ